MKGIIPEELRSNLNNYNRIVYLPAKHDFNVKDRRHRFTSKEVVFIIFLTLKLSLEIIKISQSAKITLKIGFTNKKRVDEEFI